MPAKIVLNGAESAEFTKELLADILGFEELADVTIDLHDVDAELKVIATFLTSTRSA